MYRRRNELTIAITVAAVLAAICLLGTAHARDALGAGPACFPAGAANRPLDLPGWRQSNSSGFGDANNTMISALAVFGGRMYATTNNDNGAQVWRTSDGKTWSQFTPPQPFSTTAIYDAKPFGSYLYIGTYRDSGGEIWRTDGTTWTRVVTGGLGDSNNVAFAAFAVFSNTLNVATANLSTGIEIWRSATGDSGSWSQVNSDGFGGGGTWDAVTMDVFGGNLYVGFSAVGMPVAELYRSNGITWTTIFTDGLGNPNNSYVASMADFNGAFYIGLRNTSTPTSGQVLRTVNGTSWTPVFTNGLGVAGNNRPYGLTVFDNSLYLVFSNYGTGAQVWQTADGNAWQAVMQGGWGDGNNQNADYFDKAAVAFNNSLYIGTVNNTAGGQIWQMLRTLYLPLILR